MIRHVFILLSALSMLLFLTTAALWVRSYYATDSLRWAGDDLAELDMWARAGVVFAGDRLEARTGGSERELEPPCADVAWTQWLVKRFDGFGGFAYGSGSGLGYQGRAWVLPLWFPFLLFASSPLAWWVRHRRSARSRRAAAGLCAACGYDLRATPERCPECGTVPIRAKVKA